MKKKNIIIISVFVILFLALFLFLGRNTKYSSTTNEFIPPNLGDISNGMIFNSNVINFSNEDMASKNVKNAITELYSAVDDGCAVGYAKGTTVLGTYTCNKRSAEATTSTLWEAIYTKYSNNDSGLSATNVSDAIDELNGLVPDCKKNHLKQNITSNSYECKRNDPCLAPVDITIGTNGVITWTGNMTASSYEISFDGTNYSTATSGSNYLSTLTATTGNKTVYVRSVCDSNYYATPSSSTAATTAVYSVILSNDTDIASVTGDGNYIEGATVTLGATASPGYTWSKWTETTGGADVSTTNAYSATINSNWAYTANATPNIYTVNYVDNLFVARTQAPNDVTATYTENGSYLTLDGISSEKWFVDALWNWERRTFEAGDEYQITIKYISGSYTQKKDTTQYPRFYFELTTGSGDRFSDRTTAPVAYEILDMPLSGEVTGTYTVDASRASATGIQYRLYQATASNIQFDSYKVQIIITKLHSKNVTFNEEYDTLDTTSKSGFTFLGWYTGMFDGDEVTATDTYDTVGNQTLYAHYYYHKLHIRYRGGSVNTISWCGPTGTGAKYSMDSSYYAIRNDVQENPRYIQNVGYGQYISHTAGLMNWDNTSSVCFSRSGGYIATSGEEWYLVEDSSKKYSDSSKTYTASGIASAAGCSLLTNDDCVATMRVNWYP